MVRGAEGEPLRRLCKRLGPVRDALGVFAEQFLGHSAVVAVVVKDGYAVAGS
jgi:hypothetical protein